MSTKATVKEKIKKTFENVDAKPLTRIERDKLSREVILGWYKANRLEKLKALQYELIAMTLSERDKVKEKILANTKKELAKEKELTAAEKEKRAEQFAQDVINIADGKGHIEKIAKRYNQQAEQEKMFYAHLKTFVGKNKERKQLQGLAKQKQVKELIDIVKQNNPALGKNIDMAIKDGNMDEFKKMLAQGSQMGGIFKFSPDDVEQYLSAAVLGDGFKSKIGWGPADTLLNHWDKFRKIGHSYVLKKCVKQMSTPEVKIPFMLVLQLSNLTLAKLKEMDGLMQSKKYLLENKDKKTVLDLKRLKFIELLHVFREKLEQRIAEKQIAEKYQPLLRKYLEQKNLPQQEVDKIVLNSKIDDLRVLHILDIAYETEGREGEWFIHALSRSKTMWRAYKVMFRESASVQRTYAAYHYNRLVNREVMKFRSQSKKWGMEQIGKEIDKLEKKAAIRPQSEMIHYESTKVLDQEMLHHDNTVKQYHLLSVRTSQIMTKQAKELLGITKSIEALRNSEGGKFLTSSLESMKTGDVDGILKKLHPEKTAAELAGFKRKMTGMDLIRAYTEKAVEFKTMQDTTRARFAVLSNNIEKGIGQFDRQWEATVEAHKGKRKLQQIEKGIQEIGERQRPSAYWAKKLALPAVFLGYEGYRAVTGKQKAQEMVWNMGEAIGGFVPVLGTALDFRAAIKGTTLAGKRLSWKERGVHVLFAGVGLIADGAMILGGLGAALRAGIGGLRTGRRALEIGRNAKTINQIANINQGATWVQRMGGRVASFFNKAHKAETATDALITARAYGQANIVSRLKKLDAAAFGKLDDVADLKGLDAIIDAAKMQGKSSREIELLMQYRKTFEAAGGVSYIKMFRKTGRTLEVPQNIIGRTWLRTKQAFQEAKSWFMGIGVPAETLREYERTFDVVQTARNAKEKAVTNLTETLGKLGSKEKEALRLKKQITDKVKGGAGADYVKAVDELSEATKKHQALTDQYKLYNQHKKILKKALDGKKVNPVDLEAAKRAFNLPALKSPTVSSGDLNHVETIIKNHGKKTASANKTVKTTKSEVERTGKSLGNKPANQKWKNEFDEANTELQKLQHQKTANKDIIRAQNQVIETASSTRSMIEMEMMAKADAWVSRSHLMSTAAKYLQIGGMASVGLWAVSAGKFGAAEQIKVAGAAAAAGGTVVGKVGEEIFIKDHSPSPAIDNIVENHVANIARKQKYKGMLDQMTKKGEDVDQYFIRHWQDEQVQELARERGLYEKIQEKLSKMGGAVKEGAYGVRGFLKGAATKIEVTASDAAKKVKEKMGG
ncbi:hypothetical protein JW911_01245 [Candidatus Peregrinibacteria bacterium]|nr:hypothetical protein [Candidatus Peregrinibacteria bacterium]